MRFTKINKIVAVGMAGVMLMAGLLWPAGQVQAVTQQDLNDINAQVKELQKKIAGYEASAKQMAAQANTLAGQIAILRNDEAKLQAEIALSQAKHDQLVAKIQVTEKRIADNSEMIGYIVAQYYYNDEVSVIERLASSRNFASFLDEEASLAGLSDSLTGIVKENKALKEELEAQRDEVKLVLENLNSQKAALVAKRAEVQRLLDETKGKEAAFQSMKKQTQAERAALEKKRAEIEAELCRVYGCSGISMGDGTKGGYPNFVQSTWGGGASCPRINMWYDHKFGMSCQCVSYTGWRVWQSTGYQVSYWGNANNWDDKGRAVGLRVNRTPAVGSVGMYHSSAYGHVVWVEAVVGDQIKVSEYNGSRVGDYAEKWISANAYDYFIHFEDWQ